MENTNQNNVETFSFEMKDYEDERLTFEQRLLQLRHDSIRILNQVSAGAYELTPRNKESLRVYNKYCTYANLEPLELPF